MEVPGRAISAAAARTANVNDVSAKGRVPRKKNVEDEANAPAIK
jgi:hypothetical protein